MNYSQLYVKGMVELPMVPVAHRFVAKHGKAWASSQYVKGGESGECFCNALHMAIEEGYLYVEGWAVPGDLFPLAHAWCVDLDGNVIDPTWEQGHDYFGVVLDTDWVVKFVKNTGVYGVFGSLYFLKMGVDEVLAHLEGGLV